jgi:hypothetical protein
MQMPLLKVKDYNLFEQNKKIKEEYFEYIEAQGKEEKLLELLDLMTASFTKITHSHTETEIQAALKKHEEKLKDRGWEFKGIIKIELEG